MRAFIISHPKSGTYLCSNLLVELGFKQSGLHLLNEKRYYEYDLFNDKAMHHSVFKRYIKNGVSLIDNLALIDEESFAVGHIHYNETICPHFQKFKLLYVSRDNDERMKSYKRMDKEFGRGCPSSLKFHLENKKISPWSNHAFNLSFEDMINKNTSKIDDLQIYLFDEIKYDSDNIITLALNKPSITKSSIRK